MKVEKTVPERDVEESERQLASKRDETAKLENDETANQHIVPPT